MSVTSKSSSHHRRNDSGELVVFEAARYFASVDENPGYHCSSAVFLHREGGGRAVSGARMSLDIPAIGSKNLPTTIQKQYMTREKKKHKQPSSPGGRLANFLNSLFNQTNSKKKKKKSKAISDDADDHDHTLDRRRSSISHFSITADCDSNSVFPAAETTPSYAKTPTKSSYKDLKSFSDRRKAISLDKSGENIAAKNGSFRNPKSKWTAVDEDRKGFEKLGDDDDDDSDSSSDLFDLPNLDFYSSGLPVYGTTNMGRIRIGAPVSSATTL